MIHLELISMKGVRSTSRFTFLHVDVQVFQQRLLRDHLGSTAFLLPLHQRSADNIHGGLLVVEEGEFPPLLLLSSCDCTTKTKNKKDRRQIKRKKRNVLSFFFIYTEVF